MKNCNRYAALLTGGMLISHSVFAGITDVAGVAARAESMQAFTAVADDPSAIFYNPAGLTQIQGTQIDAPLNLISPIVTYKNSTNGSETRNKRQSFAPNLFISSDHYRPFTLGFGLYAPFARNSSFQRNAATVNPFTGLFDTLSMTLSRIDAVPTIAYNINPSISVGASLVASRVGLRSNALNIAEDASGYGMTGQAGVLVALPSQIKLGLDYRGPMRAHLNVNAIDSTSNASSKTTTNLNFPGTISAGASWQPISPLTLSFSYEYVMWSYLKNVVRVYPNPAIGPVGGTLITTVNGKNVGSIRLGAKYMRDCENEFLVGYSFMPRSIDLNVETPGLADFDTHIASVGYSRYMNNGLRLDLGYEYTHGKSFQGTNALFPGRYDLTVHTILTGVSYNFG